MSGKTCSHCGEWRPRSQFQKRMASKDGLTASCKICLKERDRIRDKDPSRIATKERYAKGVGRSKSNAAKVRYIERNEKKRAVHLITGNAIRSGSITKKPCEVCGAKDVHAHHDDYNWPLSIRWLCPLHHTEWHRIHGEGLNPH